MSSLWREDPVSFNTQEPTSVSWLGVTIVIGAELALLWWLS